MTRSPQSEQVPAIFRFIIAIELNNHILDACFTGRQGLIMSGTDFPGRRRGPHVCYGFRRGEKSFAPTISHLPSQAAFMPPDRVGWARRWCPRGKIIIRMNRYLEGRAPAYRHNGNGEFRLCPRGHRKRAHPTMTYAEDESKLSYGMCRPSWRFLIIRILRERLPFRTSDTRPLLPM